ncbi:MAG: hypothetical protein ACR2P1_15435 [Pseudomonadales bacterium]
MAQAKTAKKTTTVKSTAKKVSRKSSNESNVEKVTETVKEAAMAGLGVYGKAFDQVQDRIDTLRKESPKKWDDFVKRGEQVKDAADERVNDINFSYKFDMEEQRAKFRDLVEALRAFVTPSKA